MKFTEYCEWLSKKKGMLTLLAEKLDVTLVGLHLWKKGTTRIPVWYFRKIQEVSFQYVTIEELVDEQSELHKHKGRRSLSKQSRSKPRELPRPLGRDGLGDQGMPLPPTQKQQLSSIPAVQTWDLQDDGQTHPLPTSDLAGQGNEPAIPKGITRVMDGLRKAQRSHVDQGAQITHSSQSPGTT